MHCEKSVKKMYKIENCGINENKNFVSFPGATHMDGFPEYLREVVDDHWGTFPPQHPLIVDLFGIFFFVLTVLSIFGNGLVIYIFLTTKSLRIPTNMFIINLALADMGVMLTQGPLMFINAFASDFWMWGTLLCKLYGCTGGIFGKLHGYVYSKALRYADFGPKAISVAQKTVYPEVI